MRQILVDHARRKLTIKRGAQHAIVSLDDPNIRASGEPASDFVGSEDIVSLDRALTALAALNPRRSQILEMRFFAGMNSKELPWR